MTGGTADTAALETQHRIVALVGTALLVAGLVLVAVVFPAEYGVDPLGTGVRLGLMPLGTVGVQVEALNSAVVARRANASAGAVVVLEDRTFREETVTFTLGPGESIEYKYRLDKGQALLYSWTATQPVSDELHGEPDGAPPGYAESYQKDSARRAASGTLTTPFSGIHGWYWENSSDQPTLVTLKSAGFYNLAHIFRKDRPVENKTFR